MSVARPSALEEVAQVVDQALDGQKVDVLISEWMGSSASGGPNEPTVVRVSIFLYNLRTKLQAELTVLRIALDVLGSCH